MKAVDSYAELWTASAEEVSQRQNPMMETGTLIVYALKLMEFSTFR